MALAQIWKGAYPLPSREKMEKEIDHRLAWIVRLAVKGGPRVRPGDMQPGPWMKWLHDAAGTNVETKLGYGLSGWRYWLTNMSSCNMMVTGISTPHVWRLFDGRRKKWDSAAAAIRKVNEDADARKKEIKADKKKSAKKIFM